MLMELKLYTILQVPLFYNVQVFGFQTEPVAVAAAGRRGRTGYALGTGLLRRMAMSAGGAHGCLRQWWFGKKGLGFFWLKTKTSSDTVHTSGEKTQSPSWLCVHVRAAQ